MSIHNPFRNTLEGKTMLKTVALLFTFIGIVPAAFADPPAKTICPEEAPNYQGQLVHREGRYLG